GDDKLGTFLRPSAYFSEQYQLALRRKRALRFVKEIDAVFSEIILGQQQETLSVGSLVIRSRSGQSVLCILFFLSGYIVKTLCPQKITPFCPPVSLPHGDGITEPGMGIVCG